MAEKIKKGFFKALPLSVVMLMTMALTIGIWQAMEQPAHAGAVTMASAVTDDTDGNGTVDQITITFSENVDIVDAGGAGDGLDDLTLTDGCTIANNVDYSATDVPTLTLSNLTGCTSGDTSITPTVTYATAGASTISDHATSTEMVNGVNVVSTDGAAPIIKTVTIEDTAVADGLIDKITFTWSENVDTDDSAPPVAADMPATLLPDGQAADFSAAVISDPAGASAVVTVTGITGQVTENTGVGATDISGDLSLLWVDAAAPANPADATNATANATVVDSAAPYLISATYADVNTNGKVDQVSFTFSEITTLTTITAADWDFSTAGDIGLIGDFDATECIGSGLTAIIVCIDADTGTFDATKDMTGKQTAGGNEPAFTYTNSGANDINDGAAGNNTATFGPINLIDGAAPVLVTTSPLIGATAVALDDDIVLTFSEIMTTTSLASTSVPVMNFGAATWDANDLVATYDAHDTFGGAYLYTITVAKATASVATTDQNLANGPVSFTFTTVAATSGGPGGGSLPASITVTAPNGGETLTGGESYDITWSAPGVSDPVSIYYSTDGGINFLYTVATGETNDGSYTWTVPNVGTTTAKVKLVSGSLNDISDANFAITYVTSAVSASKSTVVASPISVTANGTSKSTVTVTVKDANNNLLSGKTVTLASSRGTSDTVTTVNGVTGANGVATFEVKSSTAGTSTYTATAAGVVVSQSVSVVFTAPGAPVIPGETPISLSVGDLIKSSLSSTVYYYGSDGKRHIFPNEKTYKSWYVDWSNIKIVPASQLQGISLGKNVTIRPGTVLVKIQTDSKVYAVEPSGLLRWIPTETRAATLYGSNWAQRVIDVPVVFWGDYTFGSDITVDKHPTGALIQYTGTTEKYYIQGTEKRLISTAGFTANRFQSSNVISVPTSITYTTGTPLTAEETSLTRIY
jgi:hypothetical protein